MIRTAVPTADTRAQSYHMALQKRPDTELQKKLGKELLKIPDRALLTRPGMVLVRTPGTGPVTIRDKEEEQSFHKEPRTR